MQTNEFLEFLYFGWLDNLRGAAMFITVVFMRARAICFVCTRRIVIGAAEGAEPSAELLFCALEQKNIVKLLGHLRAVRVPKKTLLLAIMGKTPRSEIASQE